MDRKERTEQKVQELFHSHAAGDEGPDGQFMQILQGYIFGDVCYTGSLDNRLRELVTVTVLTTLSALPQLKAHVQASLNAGCTPVEIREAVYQCTPFIGFPKTLNAISTMNEVFTANGIDLPLPDQTTLTGEREDERYQKGWRFKRPSMGTRSPPATPGCRSPLIKPCPGFSPSCALGTSIPAPAWTARPGSCSPWCCWLPWAARKCR